jgi:hypothetical protein
MNLKTAFFFLVQQYLLQIEEPVIPLFTKNFSYSVLENLSFLKNDLSFLIISLKALSLTYNAKFFDF